MKTRLERRHLSRPVRALSIVAVAAAAAAAFTLACTPEPAPPTPTPTSSVPSASTIGAIAGPGRTVYASRCAECHGNEGQGGFGPPLLGVQASLAKYDNARSLYDYISQAMPWNAPGSLSRSEYEQVLGYLVLGNGFARESTPFNSGDLDGLVLKTAK